MLSQDEHSDPPMDDARNSLTERPDPSVALTRDDLVACVAAYRAAATSRSAWAPAVPVLGGLTMGAVMITIAGALGWPEWTQPFFFFGGWAVTLSGVAFAVRKNRALVQRWQWSCPSCDAPMIGSGTHALARAETAIASGRCPSCGEKLFPEEG